MAGIFLNMIDDDKNIFYFIISNFKNQNHQRMDSKLCPKSQQMMNLILKHYPLQQSTHLSHQKQHQHMHDYRKQRQIFEKPTKEKLQNMAFFKEEGNNHYKNQRYSQAAYFYQKVIIYGDYTFPDNEADTNQMNTLLQQSNCNMALSLIKLDKWEQAKINLQEAAKGSNLSIKCKAFYWFAKLYIKNSQYQSARKAIEQLKEMGADTITSQSVSELQAQMKRIQEKQMKQNKQICKNMFKQ